MKRCYLCWKHTPDLRFVSMRVVMTETFQRLVKRPLCPECRQPYEEESK